MSTEEKGIIHFKGVTKKFGSLLALDNVSFDIKKGEFVFITGPSGAGKTTILKLILGQLTADTGEVVIDGFNVSKLENRDLPSFRQKIGTIFQDFKVLPERTIAENVAVALAVIGLPEESWDERVKRGYHDK
jgi:cell division transport system ATP-binding protein